MSAESNIELLRRAWAAYDRGDEDEFAACLTDDWKEHGQDGDFATLADERPTMALHRVAFPDKRTEIHRIVADNETVACHCTVSATHSGPYLDLEATGKRVLITPVRHKTGGIEPSIPTVWHQTGRIRWDGHRQRSRHRS